MTYACSCALPPNEFCEAVEDIQRWESSLLEVVVVSVTPRSGIRVRTVQQYLGPEAAPFEFFIEDGNGADCGAYVSRFSQGAHLLYIGPGRYDQDTYQAIVCNYGGGIFPVPANFNSVFGYSTGMPACLASVRSERQAVLSQELAKYRVYPNLGRGPYQLVHTGDERVEPLDLVELYTSDGRLLSRQTNVAMDQGATLDLDRQPPGVYLLRIARDGVGRTQRIVRQ